MAKCLALLCKQAVTGPHRWQEARTWFTYTLAVALVAIGTFWVRSLNKGLRMVRSSVALPVWKPLARRRREQLESSQPNPSNGWP